MNQYNGLQRRYRFFMTMRSVSFLVLTLVIVSSSFVVLFTSTAKPAVASSQGGSLLWRYQTGSSVYSSPAVVNGVVYVGSYDYYVYALGASTGALLWRYQTGSPIYSTKPTVVNGVVYIGSHDNYVYALTAAGGPPPTPTMTPTPPPILPVASFTWNMAPRFGVVPSGPGIGLPMYPNDINRKTFTEQYDACGSTGNLVLYTWTYPGGSFTSTQCSGFTTNLPNGQQQVSLTVTDSSGRTSSPDTQMLQVKDFFIVSLGDSVASGEGNPDVAGQCAQPTGISFANQHTKCTVPPWWQPQYPGGHENPQCHRSTRAGSPQAALRLQNTYQHTSETFLHLACSGASIASGLLGPYAGIDNHNGSWADLPPQLQEVNTLRQGRPIDALLISIGANDINFSGILEKCLILGINNPPVDCGTSATQAALEYTFNKDLKKLSTNLDILGNCMTAGKTTCISKSFLNVPANHIFISGYFDPARGSGGKTFCDAGFGNGLSSNAWFWAESKILAPLNQLLAQKAQAFGWHAVEDVNARPYSNSFLQHGYCATQSGQPLDQSGTWIRQYYNDPNNVGDAYQGTFGIQGDHTGFMHPNYWGHQRYATSYSNALINALPFR